MPDSDHLTAIIVGGGIGGLAAALGLQRIGIKPLVFEQAPQVQEVGAGISLWSNAIKALRQLGVGDQVAAQGTEIETVKSITLPGEFLNEADFSQLSRRAGAPSICVHRADLHKTLAEKLPREVVSTNAHCDGFKLLPDAVEASFSNNRSVRGDVLIGADGIHSMIRRQLKGESKPRYAGYTAWRAVIEFEDPDLPAGTALYALGAGIQFGMLHCGRGCVYWFATKNQALGNMVPQMQRRQRVLSILEGCHPVIRKVVSETADEQILQNDIIDRPPTWPWGEGRVTTLGDAIHPTTPNMGQGACQAIEDAVTLVDSLRSINDVEKSLRSYEKIRRKRTALITRQSWSFGRILQWQNPLAICVRNKLFASSLVRSQRTKIFERLLLHELPEICGRADP